MSDNQVYCPFCGKNITNSSSICRTIPQEETVKRDFSPGATWGGNYIKETKYIRRFQVLCCEKCYSEYINCEALTDKMSSYLVPIGFIAGMAFSIYLRYFKSNETVSFGGILGVIISGVLGVFMFSIPTIIVNLAHRKKVSYKKAKACNATIG